jgi:hypothetical protein
VNIYLDMMTDATVVELYGTEYRVQAASQRDVDAQIERIRSWHFSRLLDRPFKSPITRPKR